MPMPSGQKSPDKRSLLDRLFRPILAGATLHERMVACLGATLGIGLTGLICGLTLGSVAGLPIIVAPMGASAVLLFAVPASPLAQPWPIIGGNVISALVGVFVARHVPDPYLAMGLSVALAIAVMSFTRCLHPPGGAAALTAVVGGPAVTSAGFLFPFVPVAVNSIVLVLLGILLHKLSGHAYPHRPVPAPAPKHGTADPPAELRVGFRPEDVDAALAASHETFDIDRDDLDNLLRQVELHALLRSQGALACADIMSRDIVSVGKEATVHQARALLLDHNIRTLPVVDDDATFIGTVGLRELTANAGHAWDVARQAPVAAPGDPAFGLLPVLTDGRSHAVVVVDADRRILGMITQTDLLVAAARALRR